MFVPTKPVCCGGARYLVGIIGDDGFARPLLEAEIKEACRLLNDKPALGERSEPPTAVLGEAATNENAVSERLRRAFADGMKAGDTEGLVSDVIIDMQWRLWAAKEGIKNIGQSETARQTTQPL